MSKEYHAKQSALALLAALPASPTEAQLSQLTQAFTQACEEARAAATSSQEDRPGNADVDIRLLAKEAGPLAMGASNLTCLPSALACVDAPVSPSSLPPPNSSACISTSSAHQSLAPPGCPYLLYCRRGQSTDRGQAT